ncbi:putative bifunctional diguanylate cyclase/phosphodiesterase [Anaerobacillus isosaccharinicus]|uniref:EAL domain-containing protein n=1 Tax=Anaerobacillus isosaccharinicus TaxID=1532552 RepID=A0A1S2M638_9BACI|nr:EAL domain-containing protein [Anaerobacillus isosaccharinicus]MBA5584401.1 EAL domain-containing protein [Anaerobacillus isosaccharinicus]QOY37207.1 EAL domain-containing protein [Anaerobacillus isosaccharinicus]
MREYVKQFAVDYENVWNLFNHMNDGLIITDSKQNILAANPAFQKITGYQYEELFLKNPSILQSGETPAEVFDDMWSSILDKGTWTGELVNKKKNGEFYWSYITITQIKKANLDDTYYIGIIRDITSRKLAEEKISYLAFHDNLTEMPNRIRFKQVLTETLRDHDKKGERLALIFFDLDRFKIINDTFGHQHGDEMLKGVATRLKEAVGERGVIGRFGGDEFTIMLPSVQSEKEVTDFITMIYKKFTDLPIMCTGRELFITSSMGVSLFPEHGQDANTLIKNADIAMYCSKDEGRNNYQIYNEGMSKGTYYQLIIESELRKALENDEFKVYYQVQVDVKTNEIYGVEALIRWDHPERGIVPPGDFLTIAEEMGIIVDIDDWVLKTACQQVKQWNDEGNNLQVSVNISRKQFERNGFVDFVKKTIRETGIKPEHVNLEITENMAIINVEAAIKKLQALKDLGVHFSLDDFGTGYSSLSQLKRFPINTLKIDQSFVKNSNGNDEDAAIVKLIIAMAKTLQFTVTCEGIETLEQLELIKKEGCNHAQGFLFSKPINAEELKLLLKQPSTVQS